ncbi:hypothetical protein [Rhizosaccharibacter radicis]|uniref:Uncharacterized protein n=1 Tax=Rhizosaccharibacter radicis TaxID=2782605 RepID=A0ABT1VYX8_9PROT|nr:hypothetical protein [Acetobacteraceae bacterium KSS12]
MSFADKVNQFDAWLLDRVFQPVVDRLPERVTGFEVGMSLQLGALVMDTACLIAMFATGLLGFSDGIWNVLIWLFALFFYLSMNRMRPLMRVGHLNPLRPMLQGLRPLSIPFALYSVWQMALASPAFLNASRFNVLANVIYVIGLYFMSTNPRPPGFRRTARAPAGREARTTT